MKARLLYDDRDSDWEWVAKAAMLRESKRTSRRVHDLDTFRPESAFPWNHAALTHDLGLDALFAAMAGEEDDDVHVVAQRELLGGTENDAATIAYRQSILADALAHPDAVRELHEVAVEAVAVQRRHYLGTLLAGHPDAVLRWAIDALEALLQSVGKVRACARRHGARFEAPGWRRLFETIEEQLSDDYLASVEQELARLRHAGSTLVSARPGEGSRPEDFRLHPPPRPRWTWFQRLLRAWFPSFFTHELGAFSFSIAPRDESGARALRAYSNRGIAIAARALGTATEHIRDFFGMLRAETAFYVGAIRLAERLEDVGVETVMPVMTDTGLDLSFDNLVEPGLALRSGKPGVPNDLRATGTTLIVVTGANQGGKSTFLRAIGVAHAMASCGLYVVARRFEASRATTILTHYKREEDAGFVSGKFDEELGRMSELVDHFSPGALLLLNESFAATSEREASEIGHDIVESLRDAGGRVVFVTHLYEYAARAAAKDDDAVLMLRADRNDDGSRTFRIRPGEPLQTSYGGDLFETIFGRRPIAVLGTRSPRERMSERV